MKKFYIFINEEQIGPLSIEELKQHKISKETKVWFEELEDWKNANEIEELKSILISIPPPINSFTPKIEKTPETKKLGMKKNLIYGIVGGIIIILGLVYFNNLQIENRNKLIASNQQLEEQQKEIDEQKARLSKQEQTESNRKIQEQQAKLKTQYAELNEGLNVLYTDLSVAKQNLNNVSSFKILRTASERNNQINDAQNQVDWIKQQITEIESKTQKIFKKIVW